MADTAIAVNTPDPQAIAAAPDSAAPISLPDEEQYPFAFEQARRGTYRSYDKSRPGVLVLLGRLGLDKPDVALATDVTVARRLLTFGAESLLNITYYQDKAQGELRNQRIMNALIYLLSIGFIGGTIFFLEMNPKLAEAGMSQIAALVGALLAGAKFITSSWDFQKTRSSFWQAGADLKERLYHFISDWHQKAWDPAERRFRPEFVVALQEEIRKAREIQAEERERFYALMATPSKLMDNTNQLTADLQSRVGAYVQAGEARRDKMRSIAMEELRKQSADLVEMYPDDKKRPAPIADRLREVRHKLDHMEREATMSAPAAIPAPQVVPAPADALPDGGNS